MWKNKNKKIHGFSSYLAICLRRNAAIIKQIKRFTFFLKLTLIKYNFVSKNVIESVKS